MGKPLIGSSPSLTVVVPVRWSHERADLIDRLAFVLDDASRPDGVDVLVVDDGSPPAHSDELRDACRAFGFSYHRIDTELCVFSIGRARNTGAQHARGEFVMFLDADLMPYPGFFQDVLNEIEIQRLREYTERFLMFGVIYLTQAATEEYRGTAVHLRRAKFIQYLLEDDKTRIEKFSTGTSVTVWSRGYFLATGGNDPDFAGWGFEDIEYMCRAIRRAKRFALPENFALDYRGFQTITEYRGWKATYRLFGDMTFQKGNVLFHAWHPVVTNGTYALGRERNRKLFERKLAAFRDSGVEPAPLPMPERGRTLIFRTTPWVYNRWIAPWLGEITIVDDEMLSPETCVDFIRSRKIDRVVFHNPYATERMLGIYETVRREQIEFLVCERGALPGSVFFDPCGFNGESASYAPERWRHRLEPDQEEAVASYVRRLRAGEESLEDQPARVGPHTVRKKLGIAPNARVLFVPLQRPSDTVISYLCGPIASYDGFLTLVRRLTFSLPPDWVLVVKRHPLEVESPSLPGVVFADDAHVNDLVEAADALLLINSGVGVLGLAWEKPVYHAGLAFYGHAGLSHPVATHDDVLAGLESFRPDGDAIKQFLHYLLFEFYSFARFTTRRVPWKDGAMMTATTAIDYSVARIPGCPEIRMEWRAQPEIGSSSILFDRYRNAAANRGPATASSAQTEAAPAPPSKTLPRPPVKQQPKPAVSPVGSTDRSDGRAAKPAVLPTSPVKPSPRAASPIRKLNKLRRDPVMFLLDSRSGLLRALGKSLTNWPPV